MVQLYENGKTRAALVEEYDFTASALDRWISQAQTTGSFKEKDKRFVVSDLTYVKVLHRWHYVCVLIDLFNRENIGYSAGPYKDAALISRAFATVQDDLS